MQEEFIEIESITPLDWIPISKMIKVIGVGGGGCNAVSYMWSKGVTECQFYACNTDYKTLEKCPVPNVIRIGSGLGAGTRPEVARKFALEAADKIKNALVSDETKMVFVTASLGGGTGTGAAPVVAAICKEAGILTVGVVSLPFNTEGQVVRMKALDGLDEMKEVVDSLIVIDNNRLYEHCGKLSIRTAFNKVDEVLATAVESIIGIIETTGYVNVDINDVKTMMKDSGMALMGRGSGTGKSRVDDAFKEAISSPLLNNYNLRKATKVLVNITCSGSDDGLTVDELGALEKSISQHLGITDNYKKGLVFSDDPEYGDKVSVILIATGVEMMGAVPEDYFSEERDFPQISETDDYEAEGTQDKENEDATSSAVMMNGQARIMKVVSRIKEEVVRLYEEAGDA